MRARDFTNRQLKTLNTYRVRLRLKQPGGYTQQLDTTIMARNPMMARRMLQQQYSNRNVMVGNPRLIK
jgi:hypothetical protein